MSYESDYERATEIGRRIVTEAGGDPDARAEAVAVYADRVARLWLLRDRWERGGRPALSKGSKRQTTAHPFIAMLLDAEGAVLAAEKALAGTGADGRIGARLPHLKADLRRPTTPPLGPGPAAALRRVS